MGRRKKRQKVGTVPSPRGPSPETEGAGTEKEQDDDSPAASCNPSSSSMAISNRPPPAPDNLDDRCPKHPIFLSHSGQEKDFVAELCYDLDRIYDGTFFDQKSDSLPFGEEFADLIFEAARHCRAAVVVVSEGYLSSKWPMLELAAFVEAKKSGNPDLKLVPLFYKAEPEDLNKECWREGWKKLVKKPEDVEVWNDAVRELKKSNGLSFKKFGPPRVLNYRRAVVEHLWDILTPPLPSYVSDIQGYDRLCKATAAMFVDGNRADRFRVEGCQYLGLYGIGGMGKTTTCIAMCNYFRRAFYGRVCHVELGGNKSEEKRLRSAMQQLKDLREGVERISTVPQMREWVRQRLERGAAVLVVVDNVGDEEGCREEARFYANARFVPGSKVLVTARSRAIVESVLGEAKYCEQMGGLEVGEAARLLLSKAAPHKGLESLESGEKGIVEECVGRCLFQGRYHPLALKALGVYLYDIAKDEMERWVEHLGDRNKFEDSRERIFEILGLGFETLDHMSKLIFLDLRHLFHFWHLTFVYDLRRHQHYQFEKAVDYVSRLHDVALAGARAKVLELQRKGFLQESNTEISLHDLYWEFGDWLLSKCDGTERKWPYLLQEGDTHKFSRTAWPSLLRVRLTAVSLVDGAPKMIREWRNLVFLELFGVKRLQFLNLQGLEHLRVLMVRVCDSLEEIVCRCDSLQSRRCDTGGCLPDLQAAALFYNDRLREAVFLSHCPDLKIFSIDGCLLLGSVVDLRSCSKLESVVLGHFKINKVFEISRTVKVMEIECPFLSGAAIPRLDGHGSRDLRLLYNDRVWDIGAFLNLSVFSLRGANDIEELRGIEHLSHLTTLVLEYCSKLCSLPDLASLRNLRWLCMNECRELRKSVVVPARIERCHHCETFHKCFERSTVVARQVGPIAIFKLTLNQPLSRATSHYAPQKLTTAL